MTQPFTRADIEQVLGITEMDYNSPNVKWIKDTKEACGATGNTGLRETWIARLLKLSPTGGGAGKPDMIEDTEAFVLPSNGKQYTRADLKHLCPNHTSIEFKDGLNTYRTKLDEGWLILLAFFDSNGKGLIYLVGVDLRECEQELHANASVVRARSKEKRQNVSVKADVWMNKPSTFVLYKNEALYYRTKARHDIIKSHAQIDKLPCRA